MTKTVREIVSEIKAKMDQAGGLKHVYFVACGGSKAAIFPGLYLLQSEAKTFSATTYTSNEFVHATPKELDNRCVAVICSLKATPETVEAVKTANAAGAVTIAMTGSMETGMAKVGQYVVTYSNGDDQVYSDSNQANALRIGFELLKQFENYENYDKAMEYLKKAENLGMNIGDSHVFWEIKEIKDNERKYNSEPNKDLENKRDEYLNKFSEINNEVSEFNYSGTDTQIKDTYSLVLKKWDNALNEIYNDLKNILSSTDMELLRIAQKDWVIRRDKRAEEDSKMYGSNSTEEIEYTKSLADSTKERYYELIENYLN